MSWQMNEARNCTKKPPFAKHELLSAAFLTSLSACSLERQTSGMFSKLIGKCLHGPTCPGSAVLVLSIRSSPVDTCCIKRSRLRRPFFCFQVFCMADAPQFWHPPPSTLFCLPSFKLHVYNTRILIASSQAGNMTHQMPHVRAALLKLHLRLRLLELYLPQLCLLP